MKTLTHFLKVVLRLDGAHTQVSDAELSLLKRYAAEARVVVELGCFEGKTSVELAGSTDGAVYAVDTFYGGRLGICYGELIARIERRRANAGNLFFLKTTTSRAAESFSRPVDFIFIDADHSYDAVKADFFDWLPRVKPGGFIAMHDCKNRPGAGSARFYDECVSRMPYVSEIDSVDSLVVLRKSHQGCAASSTSEPSLNLALI